jgi:hypothetical protein
MVVISAAAVQADWTGEQRKGAARVSLYERSEMRRIKAAAAEAAVAKTAKRWAYASVANCPGATPDSPASDDLCTEAARFCAGNTPEQGLGPSVRLFRRQVDAAGEPLGPWEQYGVTCFPEEAPGAKPALTMQQVLQAFHDTKFAKPKVEIQPKGNVTLVTLPTYFQLVWPSQGFQPDEVDHPDPARLAGFQVEIRPTLKSVNYVYGDGTSSGATESLGGPYPEGDIVKKYDRAGTYDVRADVTYGGQFRVGGGQWIDIPGQVVIQGSPEPLQVRTAHARLVNH